MIGGCLYIGFRRRPVRKLPPQKCFPSSGGSKNTLLPQEH